tara:strand:+ start:1324 stop:2235 length:912 start_codon:yes stop_codon:yes gene_type:complete
MNYFPIIIFGYNRPKLLESCLSSLKKYDKLKKHKIFFFCDGPKNDSDKKSIREIKNILNLVDIKFEKKFFLEKNYGLAKNIISGVSKILKKNKAAIILEDDLYLSKNAIPFINFFLNKKKEDKTIGSVSAYSYIHNEKFTYKFDCYYSKRHCSWAWGTWTDRWKNIKWESTYVAKHFKNKNDIQNFDEIGQDLNLLLWAQKNNIINSWAIRFNQNCANKKLLSLQPRYSLVRNNGHGKNATHQRYKKNILIKNFFKIRFNFFKKKIKILYNNDINQRIRLMHKKSIRLFIFYWASKLKIFNFK